MIDPQEQFWQSGVGHEKGTGFGIGIPMAGGEANGTGFGFELSDDNLDGGCSLYGEDEDEDDDNVKISEWFAYGLTSGSGYDNGSGDG